MRPFDGFAVAGATAAYLHGIGDFHPDPYEIAAPRRFNSRMGEVRFPIAHLSDEDVAWKSGIPVMRVEATLAALAKRDEEGSLVAGTFVDAVRKYGGTEMDVRILRERLGEDCYADLLRAAGIAPLGSLELVETDAAGHVALIEKKEAQ
ncbi:type IV toxin-antitoxin system AbiEi family antitoxin [Gordonibacter urolithinfaciens]|uniref:type IV toxin-antitoxin system AbiEi family antitoxin n=1 Tax=Gordonibacter urolithinfaciens TaxID=1335613 RepID=UPI003AADB5B1